MKTSEYRVRAVTRYIVTHFESEDDGNGRCSSGCMSYGEFDHLAYAERVGRALHAADPGSTFGMDEPAAVERHLSDCAVHNEPAFPAGPCDCGAEQP